jgi:hypothetical protein
MSSGEPAAMPEGLHCPSARPDMERAAVFGIVVGTVEAPRIGYLARPLPVAPEVLAAAGAADPGEVFRIAAPCSGAGCRHFVGGACTLAARIVGRLPIVAEVPPPCALRPKCVWWHQEGLAACRRCPQVVSRPIAPSAELVAAADPSSPV